MDEFEYTSEKEGESNPEIQEQMKELSNIKNFTTLNYEFKDEEPVKTEGEGDGTPSKSSMISGEDAATKRERKFIEERKQTETQENKKYRSVIEEVSEEVKQYLYLMERYRSIPYKEDGREIYLVNIDWMDQWKKYTCYYQILNGFEINPSEPDHFEKYMPARINNEILLMNK